MAIKESSKIIILMRHATRAFDGDHLSMVGRNQAIDLPKILAELGVPMPTRLHSSPKTRTLETLRFLAGQLNRKIEINPHLDERGGSETLPDFERRVLAFIHGLETSETESAIVCSHLDWLETAALLLTSNESDLDRAEPWSPMAIRAYIFDEAIWKRLQERSKA